MRRAENDRERDRERAKDATLASLYRSLTTRPSRETERSARARMYISTIDGAYLRNT